MMRISLQPISMIVFALAVCFHAAGMAQERRVGASSIAAESELTLSSGWRMRYLEKKGPADAPVVLFIHGFGGSSAYWKQTLERPEIEKYRSVAIDMLGFGSSEKPEDFDFSMEKQADAIHEFLALKKIGKVILVGHSMGASVSMAMLQRHPDILQKIVLVDGALASRYLLSRQLLMPEWQFKTIFPLFKLLTKQFVVPRFFKNPTEEMLEMAAQAMKQGTAYSMNRSIKNLFSFLDSADWIAAFMAAKIPHYYIYGTADAKVTEMVQEYFSGKPWVHSIDNVKHCPMVEDPGAFGSALGRVLSQQN